MSIILGFTIFVMILFSGYMAYRLFLKRKLYVLAVLALQLLSLTIAVLGFAGNVQTTSYIEAVYIIFGIAIPAGFFTYDYVKMVKKIKDQGVYRGLVEPEERKNDVSDETASHKQVSAIIKERQSTELAAELSLNTDDILKNIKKSLTQSQTYINSKEYGKAYEIYNTLVKLVKGSPGLYYNHGNLCYYQGDYQGAVQSYKKVLELIEKRTKQPGQSKDNNELERKKSGILHNSYDSTETGEEIKNEKFSAYFNLGNAQFRLNRFQQAIECYKKALEINPGFNDANENIARALIALEKTEEAIEYYQKVIEKDSTNYSLKYKIGKLLAEAKKYEKAVESFKECLKLKPSCVEAYEEMGRVYSKLGKYEDAIEAFKKLTRLAEDDYRAYYHMGMAMYLAGRKVEAVEAFKKVIGIKEDHFKSHYNMAVALDELGKQNEAVAAFRKVIEYKSDFIDAYNNLGIILSTQGKHKEALEVYVKGLKKNPEQYSMYFNMGITLFEMGRYEEAVEAYRNALEIKPDEHEISYHLGNALMEIKRYNEAIEAFKDALKVKTSDSDLFYNMATVYSVLRKHDIAMDNLKRAIELNSELKMDAKHNRAFDSIKNKAEFKELVS